MVVSEFDAWKWFRKGWDKRGEVEVVTMVDDYDLSRYEDDDDEEAVEDAEEFADE